jgi:hypothetical protein
MTTITEIPLSIYPYSVYVLCSDTYAEIMPKLNAHRQRTFVNPPKLEPNNVPEEGVNQAYVIYHGSHAYIVLPLDKEANNRRNQLHHIPTLTLVCAHEALHVTSLIMEYVGIRWDTQNDEPIAYLVGHISKHAASAMLIFLEKANLLRYVTLTDKQATASKTKAIPKPKK